MLITANGIKTCKKTDPDVNQCLGKATEEAMYILKHGKWRRARWKFI